LDRTGIESVIASVENGSNVIDTSVHYTKGESEYVVGAAIRDLCERGVAERDELVVVTKVGHISEEELASRHWAGGSTAARREVSSSPVGGHHCIHPDLLSEQVAVSTARLGTTPDIVLLHNPEFYFTARLYEGERDKAAADAVFYERLTQACFKLEEMVQTGSIGSAYGVSCNPEGCVWSVSGHANRFESVSLQRVLRCAKDGAGGGNYGRESHSLRVLQLPLNLLELGGAMGYEPIAGSPTVGGEEMMPSALRQARAAGVSVMVNRPLKAIPPHGQASRHLHLGQKPTDSEGDIRSALLAAFHRTPLAGLPIEVQREATLAQLALWLAASTHGVDVALCQARDPAHREELAAVCGWPRAPEASVWASFDLALDEVARLS